MGRLPLAKIGSAWKANRAKEYPGILYNSLATNSLRCVRRTGERIVVRLLRWRLPRREVSASMSPLQTGWRSSVSASSLSGTCPDLRILIVPAPVGPARILYADLVIPKRLGCAWVKYEGGRHKKATVCLHLTKERAANHNKRKHLGEAQP